MALFKIFNNIDSQNTTLPSTYTKGYMYYDAKESIFYIDTAGEGGTTGARQKINAWGAEKTLKDSLNQQIDTTYIKGISISENKLSYTLGDGTTHEIGTFLTTTTPGSIAYYSDTNGTFASDENLTWNSIDQTLTANKLKGYVIAGQKAGTTLGTKATAEGDNTTASGDYSHAEGQYTTAFGEYSHAEGQSTTASGNYSHAEGLMTIAGHESHAEGYGTIASGISSHAEGAATRVAVAGGFGRSITLSKVEGQNQYQLNGGRTIPSEVGGISVNNESYAITAIDSTRAIITLDRALPEEEPLKITYYTYDPVVSSGKGSHAEGMGTIANHRSQHVFGEYNIADDSTNTATNIGNYIEIVGNGTSSSARSNARTLDWNGNEILAGKLTVGVAPTANMDVATKQYVDNILTINDAPGAGKTLTAFSQENGKISATFGNISITKSQVTDFPTSMPASDVSAWAKASTKPTYSLSEITGADEIFKSLSYDYTTNSSKNTLKLKINNSEKNCEILMKELKIGDKSYFGNERVEIGITDLGLTKAMTFRGVTETALTDEATTSPVSIIGSSNLTPAEGDVVLYKTNSQEFVWSNGKWHLLGLASSFALQNHIHGNITNDGKLQTNNGNAINKVVVTNSTGDIIASNNSVDELAGIRVYRRTTGYNYDYPLLVSNTLASNLAANNGEYTDGVYSAITSNLTTPTVNLSTGLMKTPGGFAVGETSYGEVLPDSGVEGQLFFQLSNPYYELPAGGTSGQVLMKSGNNDREVSWGSIGKMIPNNIDKYYITGSTNINENSDPAIFNTSVYVENSVLFGAAWNDYAEYRKNNEKEMDIQKPGKCVKENGDGTLSITTKRLERGCEIISDTFGFAIGQDKENGYNTPIAASGRVLVYPYEPIEDFKSHIGYPVCSGPNGTVSIMTDEEEKKYPSRVIGTISEIPNYDEWGTGKIKVDGRIWIRIK